ncbi:MAG: rcp1 3 [Bacteroidota bacterium]|nr:rcp1 3 [Bacteroidota bacterium]
MVIDDDDDDREIFRQSLNQVSQDVGCLSASSGKDALEYLNNPANAIPNVIFLDINMPVMTGWQFLTTIKHDARNKNIPVIMFSSSSNIREVNIAYDLGAQSYCVKPDNPEDLRKILSLVSSNIGSNFMSFLSSGPASKYFQSPATPNHKA